MDHNHFLNLLQHFLNASVRLKARWTFRLHVWSLNAGQQCAVQLCRVGCWGPKGSAVCLQSRSDNTQNPSLFEAFHHYWRVKLDCMETRQTQQKGHKVGQAFIIDNRWKTHFFYFLFPPTKRVSPIEVLSISSNSQGTRKATGSPCNCEVTYQSCSDEGLIQSIGRTTLTNVSGKCSHGWNSFPVPGSPAKTDVGCTAGGSLPVFEFLNEFWEEVLVLTIF